MPRPPRTSALQRSTIAPTAVLGRDEPARPRYCSIAVRPDPLHSMGVARRRSWHARSHCQQCRTRALCPRWSHARPHKEHAARHGETLLQRLLGRRDRGRGEACTLTSLGSARRRTETVGSSSLLVGHSAVWTSTMMPMLASAKEELRVITCCPHALWTRDWPRVGCGAARRWRLGSAGKVLGLQTEGDTNTIPMMSQMSQSAIALSSSAVDRTY